MFSFGSFSPGPGQAVAELTSGDDVLIVTLDPALESIILTLNGNASETFHRDAVKVLRINAREGDDVVQIETKFKIEIFGDDGNDSICGASGSETIHGGAGTDTLDGGGGNDFLVEAESSSNLDNENDMLFGQGGSDWFDCGGGDDIIDGGSGTDTANFTRHNDRLSLSLDGIANDGTRGSAGGNLLRVERINSGQGRDLIIGSSKSETISGGGSDGADTIFGMGGDDQLSTVAAGSQMDGGSGDDQITGRNATVHGQSGDDDITLRTGDGTGPANEPNGGLADGGSGNDTLRGIGPAFTLQGHAGDDLILYSAQSQAALGGVIPDITPLTADISGGGGRDTLELVLLIELGGNEGGYGIDFDDIANDGVQDMQGQMNFRPDFEIVRGSQGRDTLVAGSLQRGIHIDGGPNNDTIIGGNGASLLEGGDGNDQLTGGPADDVLRGGPGMDQLTGAGGSDSFNGGKGNDVFYARDLAPDTINGAQGLDDIAELDDSLDTLIRVEREI